MLAVCRSSKGLSFDICACSVHAKGGPPPDERPTTADPSGALGNGSYYDYRGMANVSLFLQLAAEYDLFVIWRFGPYVCAEWPDGGLPGWLKQIPGMKTRQYNAQWIAAVERWGQDHVKVIEPFLAMNGGPIIASQIENEYGGTDMDYFAWMANFTQRLIPSIAWLMCGHVAAVANGTIHTANGCANPEAQGIGPHTTPGLAGEPRLYTEDEQWFDYWGQPNIQRQPIEVAYGVAGFIATGGSMHNYYMWHGGNHYYNWSQAAPSSIDGPVSSTNTVRCIPTLAAPLRRPFGQPRLSLPSTGTRTRHLCTRTALATSHCGATLPLCTKCSTPPPRPCSQRCLRG